MTMQDYRQLIQNCWLTLNHKFVLAYQLALFTNLQAQELSIVQEESKRAKDTIASLKRSNASDQVCIASVQVQGIRISNETNKISSGNFIPDLFNSPCIRTYISRFIVSLLFYDY